MQDTLQCLGSDATLQLAEQLIGQIDQQTVQQIVQQIDDDEVVKADQH